MVNSIGNPTPWTPPFHSSKQTKSSAGETAISERKPNSRHPDTKPESTADRSSKFLSNRYITEGNEDPIEISHETMKKKEPPKMHTLVEPQEEVIKRVMDENDSNERTGPEKRTEEKHKKEKKRKKKHKQKEKRMFSRFYTDM